jgi:hypothetical protein
MVRSAVWLEPPVENPAELAKTIVEIFVRGTEKR